MDEKITDEDLNKALDEISGDEEAVVEDVKEVAIEEKDDKGEKGGEDEIKIEDLLEKKLHETRSDWGRKQSALETQVSELSGMVQSLVGVLESQQRQEEDITGTPIPHTVEELEGVFKQFQQKQNQVKQQYDAAYEKDYLDTFGKLTSKYDDNTAKVIDNVMRKEFNIRYSNDPIADAERNFLKAKIHLMETAVERKKNPLKGASAGTYLGGAAGSENDFRAGAPIQLDEYAADFVKHTGMEEEAVTKALSGNAPLSISDAFKQKGIRV